MSRPSCSLLLPAFLPDTVVKVEKEERLEYLLHAPPHLQAAAESKALS